MIAPFLPPGSDGITILTGHAIGNWELKGSRYFTGLLLGINRTSNYLDSFCS